MQLLNAAPNIVDHRLRLPHPTVRPGYGLIERFDTFAESPLLATFCGSRLSPASLWPNSPGYWAIRPARREVCVRKT